MRRTHPKRFWLIARHRTGEIEVLTTNLARGGEALPVFSFEDEANVFLRLGALGDDWRARETGGGELVSVLCGPCAGVDRVVLDPIYARAGAAHRRIEWVVEHGAGGL